MRRQVRKPTLATPPLVMVIGQRRLRFKKTTKRYSKICWGYPEIILGLGPGNDLERQRNSHSLWRRRISHIVSHYPLFFDRFLRIDSRYLPDLKIRSIEKSQDLQVETGT